MKMGEGKQTVIAAQVVEQARQTSLDTFEPLLHSTHPSRKSSCLFVLRSFTEDAEDPRSL